MELLRLLMVSVASIMRDGVVLALMDPFVKRDILWDHIIGAAGYNRSTNFGHTVGGRIDCKCFADYTSHFSNADRSFEFRREREERTLLRCQQTPFFLRLRVSS